MKSVSWLVTLVAAAISLPACSKESKATGAKDGLQPVVDTATPPAGPGTAGVVPTPPEQPADTGQPRSVPPTPADPVKGTGAVKAPPPVATGAGPVVDRPTYPVKVMTAASYPAGKPGSVDVTLTPKTGWHVNMDFPTKLEITAPEGVTLASAKLKKEDATSFTERGAAFKVAFTPASAGTKAFAAKFKFVICNDDSCDPSTEQLSWQVAVK
jgi:hypothetical protein